MRTSGLLRLYKQAYLDFYYMLTSDEIKAYLIIIMEGKRNELICGGTW